MLPSKKGIGRPKKEMEKWKEERLRLGRKWKEREQRKAKQQKEKKLKPRGKEVSHFHFMSYRDKS